MQSSVMTGQLHVKERACRCKQGTETPVYTGVRKHLIEEDFNRCECMIDACYLPAGVISHMHFQQRNALGM